MHVKFVNGRESVSAQCLRFVRAGEAVSRQCLVSAQCLKAFAHAAESVRRQELGGTAAEFSAGYSSQPRPYGNKAGR
jgi:hypothetical protein